MKISMFRTSRLCLTAGALAFSLLACESETKNEVRQTDGKVSVEKTTEVKVDPDVKARAEEAGRAVENAGREVGAEAKEAGRAIEEAGREVGADVKEGAKEVRDSIPDVDVDVDVKPAATPRR